MIIINGDNGNEGEKDHLVPGEVDAVHIGLGGTEVVLCHTVQPENINPVLKRSRNQRSFIIISQL